MTTPSTVLTSDSSRAPEASEERRLLALARCARGQAEAGEPVGEPERERDGDDDAGQPEAVDRDRHAGDLDAVAR
jgi:hypothetical protein